MSDQSDDTDRVQRCTSCGYDACAGPGDLCIPADNYVAICERCGWARNAPWPHQLAVLSAGHEHPADVVISFRPESGATVADLDAHEPCVDCVRCATCRREWCPTVTDHCPGEDSWWRHPTGRGNVDDGTYCYKCTECPGGYFQFHDPAHPACTEVKQPPHFVTDDGRGTQ